jgi:hypothetical protein
MSESLNRSHAFGELRLFRCCLVISFLLGCSTTLPAQDARPDAGAIAGKVYDPSGAAFGEAVVRARRSDLGPAGQTDAPTHQSKTSADGTFAITDLPAGIYRVTAFVRDAQMFAKAGVTVEAAKVSSVDVRLEDRYQLSTLGDNQIDQAKWDRAVVPTGLAPRTLDGRPDFSGVWAPTVIVDPGKSDMLPWARSAVRTMIEGQGKDTPTARCLPWGSGLDSDSPFKFVQSPSAIVILTEDTFSYRQIFLDGRAHPQDGDPTWMGHSVGHWEGDTLVVDTTGFNDKAWSPPAGYPHTEKLHMVERLRRIDLGHLEIEMTIDDPGTYKQTWTLKRASHLLPNDEIGEYVCAENNQDAPHMVGK